MTRLLFGLCCCLWLAACGQDNSDTKVSDSGLPQAQRSQEDNPAGVKFNEEKQFKSLSDSPEH